VSSGWQLVIDLGNPYTGIQADTSQPGRIVIPFASELSALGALKDTKLSVVRAKPDVIQGEVVEEDHDPGQ
jgi:hypothetical protein